jgi:hypothetical protein
VGLAASLAFANTPIFASPLMTRYFGGADLSLFVGALVSFAVYYPWASSRKKACSETPAPEVVHHERVAEPEPTP